MKGLALRPLPLAISTMVRPEATERSSSDGPVTFPSTAPSSRCLISIQLFFGFPGLSPFSRTMTQEPCMRSPSMTNLSSPLRSAASMFSKPFSGAQ
jgi:hypothetical protein